MPLEVREENIPGAGRRYEIDLDDHESIAVMIYSDGRRELFYRDSEQSEDYRRVLQLSDAQARTLGLFLVGAYYQPIASKLGEQSEDGEYIEWYTIDDGTPVVGKSVGETDIQTRFGGTVLGIERNGSVQSTVDETPIEVGHRLIVLGTDETHRELTALLDE